MECSCDCLRLKRYASCVSFRGSHEYFDIYFEYKNPYGKFFGIKCCSLLVLSYFIATPNTFLIAHTHQLFSITNTIGGNPIFKDGKNTCKHCTRLLDSLRGGCTPRSCIPTLEYI
jgi:hypothetical protein